MTGPPIQQPFEPAHIIEMTVAWGHCDPAGIVKNRLMSISSKGINGTMKPAEPDT